MVKSSNSLMSLNLLQPGSTLHVPHALLGSRLHRQHIPRTMELNGTMKLSDNEKLVLAASELKAQAPASQLRRETGLREHTIRYALARLVEKKVISPIPLINMHLIGFNIFNIFFSIGAERKSDKDALLKALLKQPEITWIGEFGGEYQYGLAVTVPNIGSMTQILEELTNKFHRIFFEKSLSCQIATTTFYRKYLSSRKISPNSITTRVTTETTSIDELDARILSTISSNPNNSRRDTARLLQIPVSTLELRLKKLEQRGVLKAYIYAVDPSQFGIQSYKLLLYAKGIERDLSKDLSLFCQEHRSIVYLIACLGNWDYEIGVEASSTEDVADVIQELYERFGSSLISVKLLTKFKDLKIRWYPG